MFGVELDLHLVFEPPMSDGDEGIVVTRTVQLPFPPHDGLAINSSEWEPDPEPHGLILKEIIWDIERSVFLASTYWHMNGLPIAGIPAEIGDFLSRGWQIGSYAWNYEEDGGAWRRSRVPAPPPNAVDMADLVDSDTYEILHKLPPRKRPPQFNALMKSLVRAMAENWGNSAVAYAMDKTGCYFGETFHHPATDEQVNAFVQVVREYKRAPVDDRVKWHGRVEKYPSIWSLVPRLSGTAQPESASPSTRAEN